MSQEWDGPVEPPNGERTAKVTIAVLSCALGILGGAISVGAWAGSVRSELEAHVANIEIHQTRSAAQVVVDREVRPLLSDIQRRLERIENKLDERAQR